MSGARARFRPDGFLVAIIVVVVLASLWPAEGEFASALGVVASLGSSIVNASSTTHPPLSCEAGPLDVDPGQSARTQHRD